MKVFLDTNVWVSALVAPGLCEDLLFKCCERRITASSILMWKELRAVLERLPHISDSELKTARQLWEESIRVRDISKPASDADARLVAAAAAAQCSLFVTGDKRVLRWKSSGSMQIVTPRDAWTTLFTQHPAH